MPKNKENVSINELMQSLKKGNAEEPAPDYQMLEGGKLVTRADGSKAIKVKSRKRRSHQPKKEKERKNIRNKAILITVGIITCLLLGIAFTIVLAYYNGTKFNEKLLTTFKNKSGADVEIKNLEVSLGNTKIHSMSFDWQSPESTVDSLKLYDIIADYGVFSCLKGSWNGPEVIADRGELQITLQDNPSQINPTGEALVDFDFSSYKCSSLSASIGKDKKWQVKNSQVEFSVNEKGEKQVYLYGGTAEVPFFKKYKIRSGVVDLKSEQSDVSLVLISEDDRGVLSMTGKVGYKSGSNVSLKTKFENAELDGWMDPRVKRFMNGVISKGEGTLQMTVGKTEDKVVVTHVKSDVIRLSNFEFIQTLGLQMKGSYYGSNPLFESGSEMTIRWYKDRTVVEGIKLEEDGDLIVTGDFTIHASGALSGKLKLGIPMESLNAAELRRLRTVFKEEVEEVVWTQVTLSGSVATPADDLAHQFAIAKGVRAEPLDLNEAEFDSINEELTE